MSKITKQQKIEEVLTRGIDEVIDEKNLEDVLNSGKKLRVKYGIDPTGADLHLGHSVPLRKLKQFQDLGHKVILLIGDYTATIGDPSGRSATRPPLSLKQIKANMKDYISQAGKILDIKKVEIRYNSEWYKKMGVIFLSELTSKFTIARIMERDDFKKRIKDDIDISMLEVLYPLLQGYDSVELKADVEIGGRDQKFNLLMGRKVQKRYDQKKQDVVMVPLLEGTDGVQKMSKSYGNYIGLSEKPLEMYGKIMSIPDAIVWKYFKLLTDLSLEDIESIKGKVFPKGNLTKKDIKIMLAKEIVKMYHSEKEAEKAEAEFNNIFKDKGIPSDIPEITIKETELNILDLLLKTKLVASKSEARRLVEEGAVKIDDKIIKDWQAIIKTRLSRVTPQIIQIGKRRFAKIK